MFRSLIALLCLSLLTLIGSVRSLGIPCHMPLSWILGDHDDAPSNSSYNEFHSQSSEDQIAHESYFSTKTRGVYLELGALDGEFISNTLFFERRGWRGVLIEANPLLFSKLIHKRPESVGVNAAVCSHAGTVHFISKSFVGGIWEFMSEEFRKTYHRTVKQEDLQPIKCLPLGSLLRWLDVRHIDFFSLDVEGAELEVLRTFDFKHTSVDVIVVEADNSNKEKDQAVRELLTAEGFRVTSRGRNDWFVSAEFAKQLDIRSG